MSRFSVKKPYTVVVGVLIILILGYQAFTKLSTDLLPSLNLPYVIIATTYPGANPETVETVVTSPVESAMATVSNIKSTSSYSSDNYSMVILEFGQDANMDTVTIDIRESLDLLSGYWPDEVGNPMILKLNPDMLPVTMLAVDKDGQDVGEISDFVNETLIQEMKGIDGVASVTASGLLESKLQVVLDQDKINALNEKLMVNLEGSFDEARDEIESGKQELENGKKQLDEQSSIATQQMLDASSAITSGKIEISKNEAQLNASLQEIARGEQELDQKEAELNAGREKLEENEETMLRMEAQLAAFQEQISSGKTRLEEIRQELEELKAEEEASGQETSPAESSEESAPEDDAAEPSSEEESTDNAGDETSESVPETADDAGDDAEAAARRARIALLEAEAQTLEGAITAAEDGLKILESQGVAVGATEAAKQQIEAGQAVIDQTREQLETGKKQIEEALAQIASAKKQLDTQESQLNSAQAQAQGQLQDARIQIITGEQQLESASKQLDEGIESAKDAADLNGIITKDMVAGILTAQNFSMPAGYVSEDRKSYLVRVGDELASKEELEDLLLFDLEEYDMGQVRLSDVARIELVTNEDENYARINGNDGIILSLEKQDGYSTADVAKRIRSYMQKAQDRYPGLHLTALMDQGIYIDQVVASVLQNLVIGAILAILVLLIFLRDLRSTMTIAVSIPVSVVFALVLMYFTGITMNIISLSGLALGVGMLVDNAIVVIENIYRLHAEGMPAKEAAVEGAKQISGAIIASTLTTICIWIPIVFAEGLTRQLFSELVLTIAYSLLASLVVALTFVPMASSRLLKDNKVRKKGLFDKFAGLYAFTLRGVLKVRLLVLILVFALFIGSAGMVLRQGFEYMGETDSTQITISVTMPEGSDFETTAKMADTIIERVSSVDDVETVGAIMGSSLGVMSSFSGTDTESVSMYVLLDEDRTRTSQEVAAEISEKTKDLACEVSVSGSSMDMSALGGSGVGVMIKGKDTRELMRIARDIAGILESVDGTVEVSDGIDHPTDELSITIDKNKAMKEGLTIAQVFADISGRIAEGKQTTTLSVNNVDLPVVVINGDDLNMTPDDIRNYEMTVTDNKGEKNTVRLGDISDIEENQAFSTIRRDNQTRYVQVSAQVSEDHNVTLVSREFEEKLADYKMPDGYSYEISGENETIMDAMRQMIKLLVTGIAIMYLIMVAQFQSLLLPFIVLFTLPLAFTGGFLALMMTGNITSVIAMVGFVMLCGIIVNNGIVFIDYANQLQEQGVPKKEALIETGRTRLRPILMTALTTILAMSTMALGLGEGTDMVQPMAIVTIGGLIYGTLMTLYVIPCIYSLIRRDKKQKKAQDEL